MANGTLSPATFVWIIPRWRDRLRPQDDFIESPDFQLPGSIWYLDFRCQISEEFKVSLFMRDSVAPKAVTYTIKINLRTHVREINKTCRFDKRNACGPEILKFRREDVGSCSSLLIICYINYDTLHPVAGKDIVTTAVQTEVANAVEWTLFNIKDDSLLRERMKQLLTKGSDHDVTICVQDKEFRAHRSILSARSPVFAMMLSHDTKENNTSTISIEDCNPESFDEFLLYVYSGRTENLTPSNALQLYYPADKYDFPVLKERCVSLLKTSLSVESICDVVLLAVKHQEKELLELATEFIAQNLKEVLVSVGWLNFMSQNPVEANELYIKSMEILLPRK